MSIYKNDIDSVATLKAEQGSKWAAINPEYAARMRTQNRFKTGLEVAQFTADIMRADMAEYDQDSSQYTQSLGCWHGFTAQQMMMAVKRHEKTTKKSYVYLSGWMV
ncbi:MAG: isocitrate lyase, partial [Moritella sp.]|nr:isocitrate lyase [Moritella sp.]